MNVFSIFRLHIVVYFIHRQRESSPVQFLSPQVNIG
jgi:hypothetical protein